VRKHLPSTHTSDERISTVIEAPAPTVDNQVRSVS
jgi:hypothetical protein